MMSEATLLESRVDKIERDNRRLKLTVGALLLVMAAVPLIGAVMPEQVQDTVRARAFYVEDENFNIRAFMNKEGIRYFDETGTARAVITTYGISYHDENFNIRASMSDDGIYYADKNQTIRAMMDDNSIGLYDENNNTVWSTRCAPNC